MDCGLGIGIWIEVGFGDWRLGLEIGIGDGHRGKGLKNGWLSGIIGKSRSLGL